MNSIAAIKDKVSVGISSDPVEIATLKATSLKEKPPKEKHIQTLISSVQYSSHSSNSTDALRCIKKRLAEQKEWLSTVKCLIVIHRLINTGNELVLKDLVKSSHIFNMFSFMDAKTPGGHSGSLYIRSYSNFISEKVYFAQDCNWNVNLGFYASGKLNMNTDKLLDCMDIYEKFFKILFELELSRNGLENPVLGVASILILKDSLTAFTSYSNILIEVLERFFTMNKIHAQRSLRMYKKCIENTANLKKLLDFCALIARDFKSFPPLVDIPTSLLPTCEAYVRELDQTRPRSDSASVPKLQEKPPTEKQVGVGAIKDTQYHPNVPKPTATPSKSSNIVDDFLLLDFSAPSQPPQTPTTPQPTAATAQPAPSFFDPFAEPPVSKPPVSFTHSAPLVPTASPTFNPAAQQATFPAYPAYNLGVSMAPQTATPQRQATNQFYQGGFNTPTTQSYGQSYNQSYGQPYAQPFQQNPQPAQPTQPTQVSSPSTFFDPFADPTPVKPPPGVAYGGLTPMSPSMGQTQPGATYNQSYDAKASQIRSLTGSVAATNPATPNHFAPSNSASTAGINLESLLYEMKTSTKPK